MLAGCAAQVERGRIAGRSIPGAHNALNIAHLELGRHAYGGAEQVKYLLRGLRGDDHHHVLVAADGGDLAAWARDTGQALVAIRYAGEHDLRMIWRLRRALRRQRIELLHVHSRRGADWLGPLVAMLIGIPVIVSRRIDNPPDAWLRWLMRRRYSRVICISNAIQDVLLEAGVDAQSMLIINSAVDAARFAGPAAADARQRLTGNADGGPLIGVIAQLIERKGHRFLLRALPGLRQAFPGLQVVLLGRGPLRDALQASVREAGLAGCVHFAGFRDDLDELLAALTLVVHPALMEGLGVALLQAAAAGVPVVGFAAGGVTQAVAHEHSGLLVAPGDPVALGAAIGRLLGDDALRARMSENARQRVINEFSIETMVQRHAALYDVLAGELA